MPILCACTVLENAAVISTQHRVIQAGSCLPIQCSCAVPENVFHIAQCNTSRVSYPVHQRRRQRVGKGDTNTGDIRGLEQGCQSAVQCASQ
eukprot:1154179-Pelagomonas_calceolata.AAC.2